MRTEYMMRKLNGKVMTSKLRRELMYRQRGRCGNCRKPEWKIKMSLHAHRIKYDGLYEEDNVILLCPRCHRRVHRDDKNE